MIINLSPYEKNRIIKDNFGKTEMGRDLLAQDYILKQMTSSLIYPEDKLGKKFWDKVYERAWKEYGSTDVPVNTFNKVWIIPDEAVIYESGHTAYILRDHLKVMLEEDYLSLEKHNGISAGAQNTDSNKAHSLASGIIKEIILPELEKEVNEGKNFANLRQIYSGMILAAWYKHALKESLLGKIYANKAKVKGVDQDPKSNEAIYHQYLRAFKKGVFNYIREDVDKYTNETIPRKYFSGGTKGITIVSPAIVTETLNNQESPGKLVVIDSENGIPPGTIEGNLGADEGNVDAVRTDINPAKSGVVDWDQEMEKQEPGMKVKKVVLKHDPITYQTGTAGNYFLKKQGAVTYVFYLDSGKIYITDTITGNLINNLDRIGMFKQELKRLLLNGGLFFENNLSVDAMAALGITADDFGKNKADVQEISSQLEFIRTIEKGQVVSLDINGFQEDDLLDLMVDISSWLNIIGKRHQINSVGYAMKEILKNAFVHGSKMDTTLPIYIYFNQANGDFEVWDTKNTRELPANISIKWAGQGLGVGLSKIGAVYKRETVGSFTRVVFTPSQPVLRDNRLIKNPSEVAIIPKSKIDPTDVGGIDLNSINLNLLIKRDGNGVPLPISRQDMAQLSHIQGFVPKIIEIKPVVNLPIISELQQKLSNVS